MEDQKAEAAASESKGFENGLPRHGFRQSKPGRGRPNGRVGPLGRRQRGRSRWGTRWGRQRKTPLRWWRHWWQLHLQAVSAKPLSEAGSGYQRKLKVYNFNYGKPAVQQGSLPSQMVRLSQVARSSLRQRISQSVFVNFINPTVCQLVVWSVNQSNSQVFTC